jgi:hypothetical protein
VEELMDDKALLAKAREARTELRNQPLVSLQHEGFVSTKGEVSLHRDRPCLGLLTYAEIPLPVKYWIDYNVGNRAIARQEIRKLDVGEAWIENERSYVDWVTKESVWAPVFVSKGVQEIGLGSILNTHMPTNFTVQASLTIRTIYEFSSVPQLFAALVREGVEPHAAIFMGHMGYIKDGIVFNSPTIGGGHCMFQHYPWPYVKAMERGEIREDRDGPFSTHTGYGDYSNNFKYKKKGTNIRASQFFGVLQGNNTLGVPVFNPFHSSGRAPLSTFVKNVKNFINMMENGDDNSERAEGIHRRRERRVRFDVQEAGVERYVRPR